jgi:hypothetical protein
VTDKVLHQYKEERNVPIPYFQFSAFIFQTDGQTFMKPAVTSIALNLASIQFQFVIFESNFSTSPHIRAIDPLFLSIMVLFAARETKASFRVSAA